MRSVELEPIVIAESWAESWKPHLAGLLSQVVSCDRCVVYEVDSELNAIGHVPHDGNHRWVSRYHRHFMDIDPMRPANFAAKRESLIVTGWNFAADRLQRSSYYENFMRPLGQLHKAEMFFRGPSGRLIGGVRLSRSSRAGPFAGSEISLLQSMQPVAESFALQAVNSGLRERSGHFNSLTEREWEVVCWAAKGLSNKEICGKMGTSLPTVKSQIAHAFRKLRIRRRAELISLFHSSGDQ